MRPDLKSNHVTSMFLRAGSPLTGEQISKITAVCEPDTDGDCIFADRYEGHLASAWISLPRRTKRSSRDSNMSFTFLQSEKSMKLPKGVPPISALVEALSGLESQDFTCDVAFLFGRKLKPKSILGLPITCPELMRLPFDTIHGFHVAKSEGKVKLYDVIIEARSGMITGRILMPYQGIIAESLADSVLERATQIYAPFVQAQVGTPNA